MKAFYKLNPLEIGSGTITPEGFIEYVIGEEPDELNLAINLQIEEQRIASIKAKAEELITTKYSIIWQLNHPRLDETYKDDYAYIDRIRGISNEAEAKGTALENIDWGVL